MTTKEIACKDIDLLDEFMKCAFEHPEILGSIPRDVQLIILPENDSALLEANMRYLEECKTKVA
jgi:hypothetical protein